MNIRGKEKSSMLYAQGFKRKRKVKFKNIKNNHSVKNKARKKN